jgi:hypothetical protein
MLTEVSCGYYTERMPKWTANLSMVSYLDAQRCHAGKVDVLGITQSLSQVYP